MTVLRVSNSVEKEICPANGCLLVALLNMADSGTKPNPAPVLFRHFDQAIGVRFYPPSDSEHAKLMDLGKFIQSPSIQATLSLLLHFTHNFKSHRRPPTGTAVQGSAHINYAIKVAHKHTSLRIRSHQLCNISVSEAKGTKFG